MTYHPRGLSAWIPRLVADERCPRDVQSTCIRCFGNFVGRCSVCQPHAPPAALEVTGIGDERMLEAMREWIQLPSKPFLGIDRSAVARRFDPDWRSADELGVMYDADSGDA
jgi:hypothetical protein